MNEMREHMKRWATELVDETITPDPAETTVADVWASLRIFADQYLELLAEVEPT